MFMNSPSIPETFLCFLVTILMYVMTLGFEDINLVFE